jgi:hypothetical protein
MRIDSVTAHRFGPLAGQRLLLAPGLTVIYGPNEAGKSSWHAAITAALCGVRRGAGRGSRADQEFVERHRPWPDMDLPLGASTSWSVGCEVTLADGRRVELQRDLAARIATVTDLSLGRDIAGEIMHEGAPDAARWLGLNRQLFALTASATQAGTLEVVDAADGLQDYLQRATSAGQQETSGPGDGTAAAALALLDRCQREQIGMDRQGSTKPLRVGREAVAAADGRVREARAAHLEQERLAEQVARCQQVVIAADHQVELSELRWEEARRAAAVRALAEQRRADAADAVRRGPLPGPSSAPIRRWPAPSTLAGWGGASALALVAGAVLGAPALGVLLAVGVLAVGVGWCWLSGRRRSRTAAPRPAPFQRLDPVEKPWPDRGSSAEVGSPNLDALAITVRAAQRDATKAATDLATAEAVLAERRRLQPSVAEAEERSAQAAAECARVEQLAETLRLTSDFLIRAQDTVHRQAAPALAATMRQWLPALTGGRYRDVLVDPATLQVSVRDPGGVLRRVSSLSHGTAEQIYLLLRIALLRHLAVDHEPAPLLFDEVTVHADPDRLERLLMVLHDVSVHQQVVLFSQQASVRVWADQALMPGCDKLINLEGPSSQPAAMMIVQDAGR